MAVTFFDVLCLAACAFLINVLHQFWREAKRPGIVVRPTSPPRGPRLCVVRTERHTPIFSGGRPGKTSKASRRRFPTATAALLVIALYPCGARAQEKVAPIRFATENTTVLQQQVADLRALVERLEVRLRELEGHIQKMETVLGSSKAEEKPGLVASLSSSSDSAQPSSAPASAGLKTEESRVSGFFQGTTINMTLDGYYGYNFNRPAGRVNLLRAYDVSSNSFSLNQAAIILERAPDIAQGRRFGVRLDLQYGQATETLQGSAANEPRPQVYRPVFQAYGTYVAPIGTGLTLDFGKWASAMGLENNYTKDQINYSRSYLFDFLPFYHMGVRSTYSFNDKVTFSYWLVNGVQQTEDLNGFKSQVVQLILRPRKSITWEMIYHVGREQRDLVPALNPTLPILASQPGLSTTKIIPAPDGRLHILDSYVTWNASDKLTLAAEADYVINRVFSNSSPTRVTGGAAYARYQITPKLALAERAEYLSDRGGLFSGLTQALKETTLTADYKFAEGFLARVEWRRDFSNRPFFLTRNPGVLKKEQNTATVGLVWWFGEKQGAW